MDEVAAAVADLSALLDVRGYLGEHAHEYDVAGMREEIAARLTAMAGRSVVVSGDGSVRCAPGDREYAHSLHWRALCERVDIVDVAINQAL